MRPNQKLAQGFIITALLASSPTAGAVGLAVVGLFRDKAIVRIDGSAPRTLAVGQSAGPVTLIESDSRRAVFRVHGVRRVLELGQSFATGPQTAPRASVTLSADALGHFSLRGEVNGTPTEFLIDTGASAVVIDAATATRAGLDFRSGARVPVATANGEVSAWAVRLASVRLGDLEVNQIDGMVLETPLPQMLLGASFLNRVDLRREGDRMTLTRRD